MKAFDFYKDEKVIYWERTSFSVKSNTYKDAVDIVLLLMENGLDESETVSIDGSIIFFDSCQLVPVEHNEGAATVKFFDSNDRLVASNAMDLTNTPINRSLIPSAKDINH